MGNTSRLVLQAHNSWTYVLEADELMLSVLSQECRYPTEHAEMMADGTYRPPAGERPYGGWDGWIRLLKRPRSGPPALPTGLLPLACRLAAKYQRHSVVEDCRQRPDEEMPEFPAVSLRDYQEQAVRAAIHAGRGVLDLPPRAGKTRIAAELQRRLGFPTVWLAPTERIVAQTADVLTEHFGRNYARALECAADADMMRDRRIVVMTAAMAARLPADWYLSRQMILVDEFHHAAAKTYSRDVWPKIDHIFWRFGMTGTFFRSGHDALAMHALLSQTVYRMTPGQLLEQGHLVPTHCVFLPVDAPRLRGVGKGWHQGMGTAGIHEHEMRARMAADAALSLCRLGRRVLALVGTKRQGYALQGLLEGGLPRPPPGAEFRSAEFLSTDRARPVRQRVIDSFLAGGEVRVLIGTSLLGEGVDLPSADALVYARGERAEVSLIQNAYRVGTAQPGKRAAILVDFADRHHKNLLGHSTERLRLYYREPTFSVTVLEHPSQLEPWVAQIP
ncbi:MAG: DEAD/DEAH box helicase family protein [Myxococcales bacterium]|nr:MAG: DEAD/DEAH box helicase family protein [Myxococcales bacterium]